jgi:hypothetical protein
MTLVGLILIGILVVFVAIVAIRLVPAYIEYFTIVKSVNALVKGGETKGATVADIRKAYDKRAQIDDITVVTGKDLDIGKEGGDVVIGFSYSKRVPLFGHLSVCLDFEGSTKPAP